MPTEEEQRQIDERIRVACERRSHCQGVVRAHITRLTNLIEEGFLSSFEKVEGVLQKLIASKVLFSEQHDVVITLLTECGKDTKDILDKASDLDAEVQEARDEGIRWLRGAREQLDRDAEEAEQASLCSGNDGDTTIIPSHETSVSVSASDMGMENRVLRSKLASKADEVEDLRARLDTLSQQMASFTSAQSQIVSLEGSLKDAEDRRRAETRKQDDVIERLENDLHLRDRQLKEARRLTFDPSLGASSPYVPHGPRVPMDPARSGLGRDELHAISSIVAMSNADTFRDILNQSTIQQKQFVTTLNMPKIELRMFEGDLTSYYAFTNRFDELVGNTEAADSVKLSTFMQFLSPAICEQLDCCNHKTAEAGYALAREMLKDLYGDPYLISQAWIDKLCAFGHVKTAAEMMRYASTLKSANETLSSLGYLSELECTKSMRTIIEKTPMFVQNKWRAAHREARDSGRRATLGQMIKIISNASREMNDPIYGQESLAKLGTEQDVRQKRLTTSVKRKPAAAGVNCGEDLEVSKAEVSSPRLEPLPPKEPCVICGDSQRTPHLTSRCFAYRDMTGGERLDLVTRHKLCHLCLGSAHVVADCPSPSYWKCKMPDCNERHHFTLHRGLVEQRSKNVQSGSVEKSIMYIEDDMEMDSVDPYVEDVCMEQVEYIYKIESSGRLRGRFILPILPVMVHSEVGYVKTHVLLDSGACVTLLSRPLFELLKLKPIGRSNIRVKGIVGEKRIRAPVVDLTLSKKDTMETEEAGNCVVMDELALNGRNVREMRKLQQYPHIRGLNIEPYEHDRIDILIGQDNAHLLEPLCKIKGKHKYSPFAIRTRLGWTVFGHVGEDLEFWDAYEEVATCEWMLQESLEQTVRRMWDLDKVPDVEPISPVNRGIIRVWKEKLLLKDGHWEIPIPFKQEPPNFPNNYRQAERSLAQVGRRLERNPDLKLQYVASMIKNFTSGYAEIAPEIADVGYEWYNTHQAVIAENRPGKCRIVQNASLPFQGISLNNSVHQGPNLNSDIREINIRFRTFEVAMTGDVKEMYNQVRVPEFQRDSLRFLWWEDNSPGGKIIKCRMMTHMFGGRWSGAASIMAMQHTADVFGSEYGEDVADTLKKDFYVDDWLKSVLSTPLGIALVMKLRAMLARAGFQLVKFGSNRREILDALPKEEIAKPYEHVSFDVGDEVIDKTLGSLWKAIEDVFGYRVRVMEKPPTRRGMLSTYSTIYDPMGFVGPVILVAKLLVQQVCQHGCDWDESVPEEVQVKWGDWLADMKGLEEVTIPRWLGVTLEEEQRYQIHIFVDASMLAYGANAYLCILDAEGNAVKTSLLMSKAKVNPVKQITVPRLELCAAVLGVRLNRMVSRGLDMPRLPTVFWSDSQIVLFYIKQQSRTFRTFVANRVAMIQEETTADQWRFVPGSLNVADLTSRGAKVKDIMERSDWLSGPAFLRRVNDWPEQPEKLQPEYELERKRELVDVQMSDVIDDEEVKFIVPFLSRFSQWPRLVKSVCYLRRLTEYMTKKKCQRDYITSEEFDQAVVWVVRWIQHLHFTDDQKKSAIFRKLFPQEQDGVYRVGGRLTFTNLSMEEKHPLILPRCDVTDMYVRHVHLRLAHAGVDRTYYETRRKFWILGGKTVVKKAINDCVECRKFVGKPCEQVMAPLPSYRTPDGVTPFETVGVDLFGPVLVRIGRSDHKRWCCMISCAASRASHIEIVPDLSTSSFIDALSRFIARRGRPRRIISDNGTNFVGAVRELGEMVDKWNKTRIKEYLREEKIEWRFNTPYASHHGGFWERQNRTARELMMRLVKNQTMTEFTLATVMCRIEGMMNSRPLTRLTENPGDELPLTPNHLLHVSQLQPLSGVHEKGEGYRKKWKQVELLADEFWKIWTNSYLKNLQVRDKWIKEKKDLKVGEMVLEVKPNLYRMRWPLARVIDVFPGKDGKVRSVRIKTAEGEYERPITKIVRLEVDE